MKVINFLKYFNIFKCRRFQIIKSCLTIFQSGTNQLTNKNSNPKLMNLLFLTIFLSCDALVKFLEINTKCSSYSSNSIEYSLMIFHLIFLSIFVIISYMLYKSSSNRKWKISQISTDLLFLMTKTMIIIFEVELEVFFQVNDRFYMFLEGFKLLFIELLIQKSYTLISIKCLSLICHCFYILIRLIGLNNISINIITFFIIYLFWIIFTIRNPIEMSNEYLTDISSIIKRKKIQKIKSNVNGFHQTSTSMTSHDKFIGVEYVKENDLNPQDMIDLLFNNMSDSLILFDENDQIKYRNESANITFPDPNEILIINKKHDFLNSLIKIDDVSVVKDMNSPLVHEGTQEGNITFSGELKKKTYLKDLLERLRNFKRSSNKDNTEDLINEKWMCLPEKEIFECEITLKESIPHSYDSQKLSTTSAAMRLNKKIKKYTFLKRKLFEVRLFIHAFNTNNYDILCLLRDKSSDKNLKNLIVINENKSKAISFVSHEIRTPLNCIINMLKIVENKIDEQTFEKIIKPAEHSARFLLNLVNDLLDMAQIEAGKFKLNNVDFDLKMLLSDTLTLIKIQAETRKIELQLNCDPKLPILIKSDPNRIRQITINLLGNALKFTTKGVIKIKAKPMKNSDRLIKISIKDSGIGIKEEDQRKLFQAFGRLDLGDNENLNVQGVGLGLLISNILSKNLGPNNNIYDGLQVKSKYGEGTKFYFIIEDKNEENYIDIELDMHDKMPQDNMKILINKYSSECLVFEMKNTNSLNSQQSFLTQQKTVSGIKRKKLLRKNSSENDIKELGAIESALLMKNNKDNDPMSSFMSQSDSQGKKLSKNNKNDNNFLSIFFPDKNLMKRTQFISEILCTQTNSKHIIDILEVEEILSAIMRQNQEKVCGCFDILICDDNDFNILPLKYHLEELHFKVDSCFSGEEAVNKVQSLWYSNGCCKKYLVIFLDIEMTVKNGIEATYDIIKFLNNKCDKQCIIGCTGHSSEKEKNECLDAGMETVMTKPITKGVLMNILTKYIELEKKSYYEIKENLIKLGIPSEKSYVYTKYKSNKKYSH